MIQKEIKMLFEQNRLIESKIEDYKDDFVSRLQV